MKTPIEDCDYLARLCYNIVEHNLNQHGSIHWEFLRDSIKNAYKRAITEVIKRYEEIKRNTEQP